MNGATPLHIAAERGEAEMVQLLLLKGADVDAKNDRDDHTPLFMAVLGGHVATALALLAAGADVDLQCGEYEESVVHVAATGEDVDILRTVIEHGADVNAADQQGITPLHVAASGNKVKAIDMLVEAGANIEAKSIIGDTPLHFCTITANAEASTALVQHGADVNALNNGLSTPLHVVVEYGGHSGAGEVVDVLLRSGADETSVDEDGRTAVDVARGGHGDDAERVRELLANAPADRAWRRRGYLVLCRAHPDRVHQGQESSGKHAGKKPTTRRGSELARAHGSGGNKAVGGGTAVDARVGGDWTAVVTRVLEMQEEGIFRTIVGYL